MVSADLPEKKDSSFSKLKRVVKRGFKKVVPIAVSWAAGVFFPPAGAALYQFFKEKIDNNEIPVKIGDDELKEICTDVDSIEAIQNKLGNILSEKHRLNQEQLEMILGTILRPLNEAINDVMEYIREYPEHLSYLMEEWRAENRELIDQLNIKMEIGFDEIKNALSQQSDKINLIIRKLSIFEKTLDQNFAGGAKNIFSSEKINEDDLKLLSRAQLTSIYHNIRSPYDITFNPDLYVRREAADLAFEDFLIDLTSPYATKFFFLVLAGAGMGKTWTLAYWAKKLSEEGFEFPKAERFIPFFLPLKLDFEIQLKVLTGTNSIRNTIDKLKYVREISDFIPILFLDGLDEIRLDIAEDILHHIITLSRSKIPVVLSCRDTDWSREEKIFDIQASLRDHCFEHDAGKSYDFKDISCPPSLYLEKFTNDEFSAAIERYKIPRKVFKTHKLKEMARYPILLRLFSEYYHSYGYLPDPEDPKAFSSIFLGIKGDPPENSILGRLGIIGTKRDYLIRLTKKFLKKGSELKTHDLKDLISEGENFRIVRSAGLIKVEWTPLGAVFKLNSLYLPYLKYMVKMAGIEIKEKKSIKKIKDSDVSAPLKDEKIIKKRKKFDYLINLGNEFLESKEYNNALDRFEKARDISEDLIDIELTKQALERINYTRNLLEKEKIKDDIVAKLKEFLRQKIHSSASELSQKVGIDINSTISYLRSFAYFDKKFNEFWINKNEYENYYKLISFRGAIIHQFEAEILEELESFTKKEFRLVEEIDTETEMGFTVKNNCVSGLGLNNCGLTILPDSIGNLYSLEELYLRGNQLTALPESIGKFTILKELYLTDNQLMKLPESFWNLKSLQLLSLGSNKFTVVPDSIGEFSLLEILYLEDNQLINIPESIGNLKSLKYLYLNENNLTTIPESIGNLKSLEYLYLSENKLNNLQETIGNLSSLKKLFLYENQLMFLPESLLKLNSLESLYIRLNPLAKDPDQKTQAILQQLSIANKNCEKLGH
ncbi:MAG: leucine-rich repeat domain-containing protein [Promethearchaeia archaeon]